MLGQDSFWGDEILSVQRVQLDWEAFWELMRGIPAMALYYALLRFWILLGDSESTVRLLSVIPAVATVPLVYFMGKRLFDPRVGLIAALLLAMNVFHIQYSQEARSYSLLILLVTLSSLFLARSVQRPSWANWIGYTVASVLSVYAHPFALLVLMAQVSSLVFLPRRDIPWNKLCLSGLALGIALLPIVLSVSNEFINIIFNSEAIESNETVFTHGAVVDTSWNRLHNFAMAITGKGGNLLFIIYLISVLASCITVVRKWLSTRASFETWKYILLLSWLFLPIIITIGYSLLVESALVDRYLIICLPPLVMLAAVGIYQIYEMYQSDPIRVPVVSGVLVIALVALSAKGASAYHTESEKEDWRGVASLVASNWQQGDGILFYLPRANRMFQFYLDRLEGETPKIEAMVPYLEWKMLTDSNENGKREAIVQRLPSDPGRVWLVQGRVFTPERLEIRNTVLAALACKYQSVEVKRFTEFSKVEVALLQRKEAANVAEQRAEGRCNELSIARALRTNIIEDFENADDVGVYWGRGASISARPASGVKDQGYEVQFSGGGWWDVVKVTPPIDPNLYRGISLALKGSGDVRLQLKERNSPDGRGGEHWKVPIVLTEQLRNLSYQWSDFQKEANDPEGNGVLDLDLVERVRLKQGNNVNGFVITDEWVFELVDEERVDATLSTK